MAEGDQLRLVEPGLIKLSGSLDVETVADLQILGFEMISGDSKRIEFDLSAVSVRGSAAIALLISWQRYALQNEFELYFCNAPENLLVIAEACGLQNILSFKLSP